MNGNSNSAASASASEGRTAALRRGWMALAPRERRLAAIAAAVVGLGLLWWIALGPAWATLRAAPAQHEALDAQLQRMRALAAQAQALKSQPRQNPDDAQRALEAAVRQHLGANARMVVAGERVTLTLVGASPDGLSQWLTQARVNARAVPAEARLARNAAGQWDGSVVLNLPPR